MSIKLNRVGYSHAQKLIEQGKVDRESSWSFSTEEENKILGDNNWDEYKKWFLAIDDDYDADTKAHYKFPFGKNGKVYRQGVIAAKQRAAQHGYQEIYDAADRLLRLIDKDQKEKKSEDFLKRVEESVVGKSFSRTFSVETRAVDEEARTVQLSFSSETPVKRWYGDEILLHRDGTVNFEPLLKAGSVLRNHDPNQPVGIPLKVWVDARDRKGRAIIYFPEGVEGSERAFQEVKTGLTRGVSVGYRISEYRYLNEGEKWEEFEGPALVATRWDVLEISLTPVPADYTVGVGRSKHFAEGGVEMTKKELGKGKEEKVVQESMEQAILAERERVATIFELCREFDLGDELASRLVNEGKSVEEARAVVLEELKKKKKPLGMAVEVGIDERDKIRTVLQDALYLRAAEAGYLKVPEKLSSGARDFAGMTFLEIARECLRRANIPYKGLSKMDLVARAITHTESDFPLLLQNLAHKALMDGFEAEPETWQEWCATGSVSDFKVHTLVRPGEFDDLEEVPEGGEYKYGTLGEQQEQYSIAKYGKMFAITREAIINDDLEALAGVPREMGEAARRKIGDLAYSVLIDNPVMGDGKPLFDPSHGNLAATGSVPDFTSIKEGIIAMMSQKDIGGKRRLRIRPQFILVPIQFLIDVEELLDQRYLTDSKGQVTSKPNVLRKYNITVIGEGRLDDAGTAWYLAGPKGKTVKIFFLDGNQAPTLESQQGWNVDGVEFKVRIEAGAKALSWKALYKNPGA